MKLSLALALLAAMPVQAIAAAALDGDGRIATVAYAAGGEVVVRTATGNSTAIIFAPGERIMAVDVGDPGAVDVTLSGSTDSLFVRAVRAPTNPVLTVRTDLREYSFRLQFGAASEAAYAVRFTYGPAGGTTMPQAASVVAAAGGYKLSGTPVLRPSRMSDDGVHTYIEWAEDQALPAVFALSALGEEEMVDGYMRGGVYTIDRVNPVLVFRIGKKTARADRLRR